ncbi:MAG TPA: ornithine cyclodeaminase family protein [Chryseosolibacter sp.]
MDTLLLNGNDVRKLLGMDECIRAVEEAFRLRALGQTDAPGILGIHAKEGGFHIKAGILNLGRSYFAAKTNANFPKNPMKNGLPTIQGVMVVSDAHDGRLLALMDSIEITIIRTGAATAVAAKHLANPDAKTVTIIGCGNQGRISLRALKSVRNIQKAFVFDLDQRVTENFATAMREELNIAVEPVDDFKNALAVSDICVTCTPSKQPFIKRDHIRPGTFVAAVGSDNAEKQELDPALLIGNKLVADSLAQASTIGELHHALKANVVRIQDVHAELGEVIAGLKQGRTSKDDIIIFDSTGTALQDVAAAAIVYEKAINASVSTFAFSQ